MPKITITNLNKYYVDKKSKVAVAALYNLNCEIEDNSFTIIMGESGCGKSTLLKVIAGIYPPDSGNIYCNGIDITNQSTINRNIGYISQEFALYPHLTVFDNIAYPLKMNKAQPDEIRSRVNEILTMLDMTILSSRKPKQLSIGQQQMVCLARALVKRPQILLCDEPFSNLDPKLVDRFINFLKDLRQKLNLTIIFVTHKLGNLKLVGTHLLIMNNGEVVQSGTLENVLMSKDGYYYDNFAKFISQDLGEN